jgi:hypothetical protein
LLLQRPHRKARVAVFGHRHGHQIGEQPDTLGEGQGPEAGEPGFELRQVLRRGILRLPAEHALQMFDDRMKGARRVKRRAADRHPNAILGSRFPQSFHLSGLADPGFPLDQHDLAAAVATAFPGPQQQPYFLAPDEGRGAPGPGCGKPALDITRRRDAPLGLNPSVLCKLAKARATLETVQVIRRHLFDRIDEAAAEHVIEE